MADYELNGQGNNIEYMNGGGTIAADFSNMNTVVQNSLGLFLNGGTGADGKSYPKVDMSLWDQATMCATCHVGSPFYEQDRKGNRLPYKVFQDWGPAMYGTGAPAINPLTTTVWESYDPTTGAQTSFPTFAPWAYPQYVGNDPSKGAVILPDPTYSWVKQDLTMSNPNFPNDPTKAYSVKANQLIMPNVKEMDCLFCHFKGYDNVMASVMTQAGSLNMAPAVGAGLINMMPGAKTFQGYDSANVAIDGTTGIVSLSTTAVAKILPQPDSNNCMQCHATKTLKNFPEMFGVTGNSSGFLSSAPMIYDPPGYGPLGKRMTAYDINAPFLFQGSSPTIDGTNFMSYMMPGLSYLQAMGATPFNGGASFTGIGGGNAAMTGPLYYYNAGANPRVTNQDQKALKLAIPVFARAEWFKRGDTWQDGQDLHSSFGCAGCHFTGDSTHKNQCDPGRGFDMMSGIEDSVPPLKNRNLVTTGQGGFTNYSGLQTPDKHDTRNTVKRCEFCHITHKNFFGQTIDTFGAPDPTVAHQNAGLLANIVQIADRMDVHGTFGGQGVSDNTDLTGDKTRLDVGNHLDVMDCTVCHVQKKSMVVRALDATSGNRYPTVIGTDPQKGMMGLFEDPAPDSFNDGAAVQMNQMYSAMGYTDTTKPPFIQPDPKNPGHYVHTVGGQLQEWKPLLVWQKLGNMGAPLNLSVDSSKSGMQFRRKIYLANPIVAVLWNNIDPAVDANGDGAPGGNLTNAKPSLAGYTDVFTGELLNKNNAQGYGEPIFDPWIMRDMKEGFNMGPAPLSVISIGFGGFGTPAGGSDPSNGAYESLLNPDGTFTGKFAYASLWSGAVTLTEPGEIKAYKNYRTANKNVGLGNGKSWDGTQLSLVGDPFTVTHGVKPVQTHVLGNSCADCHAPGAGFFNGDFTMTGTAIPAGATYDPTAQLSMASDPNDGNSIKPLLDKDGNYIRATGMGFASPTNMMQRPLEPFRIKALKGDLRTSFEGFNKLGQPRTSEFMGCDSQTDHNGNKICTEAEIEKSTYVWSLPMQRSDALYPPEKDANGNELAIYYKLGDIDPATGNIKSGAVPMTGQEYANYMETSIDTTLADYGIGITPKASFTVTDADPVTLGTQVLTGTAVGLTTAWAQPNATKTGDVGTVNYAWTTSDNGATITNGNTRTPGIVFSTIGNKTITLTATNAATGQSSTMNVTVTAEVPPIGIAWTHTADPATGTANITNLPDTTKYVKIYWGDGGLISKTITVGTTTTSATHVYTTTTAKIIQVYAYNSTGTKVWFYQATITP